MFDYIYYDVDNKTLNEITKIIKSYKGTDTSSKTFTEKGFQTENIVKLFSKDILKKIVTINDLYKKIFWVHFIKYKKGGYQTEHLHPLDSYSFILYLNDSDGDTVLKDPVNKNFSPKKGKIIIFSGNILHYAKPSFKGKKILVGAIK